MGGDGHMDIVDGDIDKRHERPLRAIHDGQERHEDPERAMKRWLWPGGERKAEGARGVCVWGEKKRESTHAKRKAKKDARKRVKVAATWLILPVVICLS
jgi:hypothetical protein